MHELISAGLWKKLETLAKKNKPWAGAIAYFSDASRLEFGRGDILVINASDPAIASGQTSAAAISAAQKRGAALYSLANLHAKLLVLGKFAVIGSANASKSSDNSLIEASIVTSDPGIRSQARAFIEQLVQLATHIDSKFLQRIEQIPVSQRRGAGAGGKRKPSSVHIRSPRVWIAGVREMPDDAHLEETDDIEAGTEEAREHLTDPNADIDWIRFVGHSQFRIGAKEGDAVIQVWTPPRCQASLGMQTRHDTSPTR